MYELEPDKTMVGVNVRRYLLDCYARNALVSADEIELFTNKRSDGKRNYQACKIIREYIKYGVIEEVNQHQTYRVFKPKQIQDDLLVSEAFYDLRPMAGCFPAPPMPLPIFGNKQVTGCRAGLHKLLMRHMIYCHKHRYAIRVQEMKRYSTYENKGFGTPSNVTKFLDCLKRNNAIKAKPERGHYEVINLGFVECKLRQTEEKILRDSLPKTGLMFKPAAECPQDVLRKRQQEQERYLNNRQKLSKERQFDDMPSWLVMTESLIMNLNGTAKHTPEINGRWREFCR